MTKALCEPVKLRSDDVLTLIESEPARSLRLVRQRADAVVEVVSFPYPRAGLGGARLIVSPSEAWVLLAMFSGQSEEGYELVATSPRLAAILSQPYVLGEVASYAFSPAENLLAMVYPYSCSEWWLGYDEGESTELADGTLRFPFGELRIVRLSSAESSVHELFVDLPPNWKPPADTWDSELRPAFTSETDLVIQAPWGREIISLPASPVLTFVNPL